MEATLAQDPRRLSDRDVLRYVVEAQRQENLCRVGRLTAVADFHARREAESPDPDEVAHFILTPLQETAGEMAPLLGLSEVTIEIQISMVDRLRTLLPGIWELCLSGRLDLGRAQVILDATDCLANEQDIPKFAARMKEYLDKHDDPDSPLVTLTRGQLGRAVRYRKMKFKQKSVEDNFLHAFAKRRVSFRPDDNGIGHLSVSTMLTDGIAADYRLTLIAKKLLEDDTQTRTLEQMRADVMVDLLLGRLTVGASDSELEDDETYDGRDPAEQMTRCPTGNYARPVINVTVPLATLAGFSDEPGVLSGGEAIPAELARLVAQDPGSTWYRMLTDPARGCLELSTKAYHPDKPTWREVVARQHTCIFPGCGRPSVRTELDHNRPYPKGRTSTTNLQPLCRRHHKVKHAKGWTVVRHGDGSYTWTSRYGSVFRVLPPEQPVAGWPALQAVSADDEAECGRTQPSIAGMGRD